MPALPPNAGRPTRRLVRRAREFVAQQARSVGQTQGLRHEDAHGRGAEARVRLEALGKLLLKSAERGAAIEQFEQAIRYDRVDRTALNQLVAALRMEGRPNQAAEVARQLRKVIEEERLKEVERNRIRLVVTK